MSPEDIEEFAEIDGTQDLEQQEEFVGFLIMPQIPDEPVDEFTDHFTYTVDYWKLEDEETQRDNILSRMGQISLEVGMSATKDMHTDFGYQGKDEPIPMAKVVDIAPEAYTQAVIDQEDGYAFKIEQIPEEEIPQEFREQMPATILENIPLYGTQHYQATDQILQDHGFDTEEVANQQSAAQRLLHQVEKDMDEGEYTNRAYGQEKGFLK